MWDYQRFCCYVIVVKMIYLTSTQWRQEFQYEARNSNIDQNFLDHSYLLVINL